MKIPDKEKFMAPYDGMKRVRKGFFAYHIDLNTAYPLIERLFDNQQTCQLTEVFLVKPTDTGVFMSRNGSFVELAKIGWVCFICEKDWNLTFFNILFTQTILMKRVKINIRSFCIFEVYIKWERMDWEVVR